MPLLAWRISKCVCATTRIGNMSDCSRQTQRGAWVIHMCEMTHVFVTRLIHVKRGIRRAHQYNREPRSAARGPPQPFQPPYPGIHFVEERKRECARKKEWRERERERSCQFMWKINECVPGLFCKRALWNRLYSAKETYNFKEPTNRSHPIAHLWHTYQ